MTTYTIEFSQAGDETLVESLFKRLGLDFQKAENGSATNGSLPSSLQNGASPQNAAAEKPREPWMELVKPIRQDYDWEMLEKENRRKSQGREERVKQLIHEMDIQEPLELLLSQLTK